MLKTVLQGALSDTSTTFTITGRVEHDLQQHRLDCRRIAGCQMNVSKDHRLDRAVEPASTISDQHDMSALEMKQWPPRKMPAFLSAVLPMPDLSGQYHTFKAVIHSDNTAVSPVQLRVARRFQCERLSRQTPLPACPAPTAGVLSFRRLPTSYGRLRAAISAA